MSQRRAGVHETVCVSVCVCVFELCICRCIAASEEVMLPTLNVSYFDVIRSCFQWGSGNTSTRVMFGVHPIDVLLVYCVDSADINVIVLKCDRKCCLIQEERH